MAWNKEKKSKKNEEQHDRADVLLEKIGDLETRLAIMQKVLDKIYDATVMQTEKESIQPSSANNYEEPAKSEPVIRTASGEGSFLSCFNETVNNDGDLSMLGLYAVNLTNDGFIEIKEETGNRKMLYARESQEDCEIYPSKYINEIIWKNRYEAWFEITRTSQQGGNILLEKPAVLHHNRNSGKIELLHKGIVKIY